MALWLKKKTDQNFKPVFSKSDTLVKQIGKGVSGTVSLYQSKKDPNFLYVVKTYHCKEKYETKTEYKHRVLHEYRVLSLLHHVNFIVPYKYSVSLGGLTVRLYLQAGGRNLQQLIRKCSIDEATEGKLLCLWKQLFEGVCYLHHRDICHRDLKLENLVVDEHGCLRIIDLATAHTDTGEATGLVGSEHYASPESFQKLKYNGFKADIWSMGIILYYMVKRTFPFSSSRLSDSKYLQFKDDPIEVFVGLPHLVLNLLSHMLISDPEKRSDIAFLEQDHWLAQIPHCSENTKCANPTALTKRQ